MLQDRFYLLFENLAELHNADHAAHPPALKRLRGTRYAILRHHARSKRPGA
jgi:hypothetical protein